MPRQRRAAARLRYGLAACGCRRAWEEAVPVVLLPTERKLYGILPLSRYNGWEDRIREIEKPLTGLGSRLAEYGGFSAAATEKRDECQSQGRPGTKHLFIKEREGLAHGNTWSEKKQGGWGKKRKDCGSGSFAAHGNRGIGRQVE